MSDMRVLFVTNQAGREHRGRSFRWLGIEFVYAGFTFEDLVKFRRAPDRAPVVDRVQLDQALEAVASYDGVVTEEPEAILLGYVAARRGLPDRPWLVNVVQRMQRARSLRAAIARTYGEDPLQAIAASAERFWMVTTESHVSALVGEGIRADRVFLCRSTSDVQAGLFPESEPALAAGAAAPLPPQLRAVRDQILLAGTNNRDVWTAARAAELLGRPIHVLTDLSRLKQLPSTGLLYHDRVPQAEFVAAVAHASVLVIPLVRNEESCGQQSLATAQRVGTVVVASDLPALHGYIVHGQTGFLAEPENPEALAHALRLALQHAGDEGMLEAARERDRRDTVQMRAVFERAFNHRSFA